jgi:KDO2-lipid IV(A) lauroyltransferase
MRRVGPWLREHRIARANLAAAYPEKSPAEIESILREVWANLGRVGAEYVHFELMWRYDQKDPAAGRIEIPPATLEHARVVRGDGKPGLLFTAHYGNWELCAVAVAQLGIDSLVLYRPPNNARVADAVRRRRAGMMGTLVPTRRDAIPTIVQALGQGRHVSMVVDQHVAQGVDITFFGRPCKANPTLARLARRFECPIYGARIVRLPNHRFRFEATPEIEPARDAEGKIDVQATTQRINDVIEGWVRDRPEQWLWLHRRWR